MVHQRGTKAERAAFFAEHDALFEQCSYLRGGDLCPEIRLLVQTARAQFGYAPTTITRDIMSTMLRGWRRWRKATLTAQLSPSSTTRIPSRTELIEVDPALPAFMGATDRV